MKVLLSPFITEKSTKLQEAGRYVFLVSKGANKVEIKKAVEAAYKVSVLRVNTLLIPRERKTRYMARQVVKGKKAGYKKAVVQVKGGEVIDFYDGV